MAPELSPRRFIWSAGRLIGFLAFLYLFLVSVKLLGTGFKMFGGGFAEQLISTTSNPLVGLFIGILATSLVQSSSTTTSTVVGFVASGILTIENAIPIIMGANIGTTVTSTIVSMGHVTRREEFRRAMAAATVHDFFNILTVVVLFPLELTTGFLHRSARVLSTLMVGTEGLTFASPVNFRPPEVGFDLSLHSGTKYLNGHSDLVAGAVVGRAELVERVTHKLNHLGGTLDPHACFLLHRGMKTLGVRVEYRTGAR